MTTDDDIVPLRTLRSRFFLGFSTIYAVLLAIVFLLIYFFYSTYREKEFQLSLEDKAGALIAFVDTYPVDSALLTAIENSTINTLSDEQVWIFLGDSLVFTNSKTYGAERQSQSGSITNVRAAIDKDPKDLEMVDSGFQKRGESYSVLLAAHDRSGQQFVNLLKWILIVLYVAGLCCGWLVTYLFVRKIVSPIETLLSEIKSINSDNLHIRLTKGRTSAEVNDVAGAFNQMLDRLQRGFSVQQHFVQFVSHELRAPITVMVNLTENALARQLLNAEQTEVMQELFLQEKNLITITDSLLLLSHQPVANNQYRQIRLDELVFRSVQIVEDIYPEAAIHVFLEVSAQEEDVLQVPASEPLLAMAFNNLLKNAIQYSDNKSATVTIDLSKDVKKIVFQNTGDTFLPTESEHIYDPFYRASNSKKVSGHGLGLAIVKHIAEMHNATINYHQDGANIFTFSFIISVRAINALEEVCSRELQPGTYEIKAVDVIAQPSLAEPNKILAIPTIVRQSHNFSVSLNP